MRKAQQTGVSILALAWCLYIAEIVPDNVLYGVPGIDALQDINGQKLQPLIDAWQAKTGLPLMDGIGATEMLHIFISADEAHARPGATGKAIAGYVARVVDDEGNELADDSTGLLVLTGCGATEADAEAPSTSLPSASTAARNATCRPCWRTRMS